MPMLRPIHAAALVLLAALAFPLQAAVDTAPVTQPAISSDGSRIAFVSGGPSGKCPSRAARHT